jgi:hypothetical protein
VVGATRELDGEDFKHMGPGYYNIDDCLPSDFAAASEV